MILALTVSDPLIYLPQLYSKIAKSDFSVNAIRGLLNSVRLIPVN